MDSLAVDAWRAGWRNIVFAGEATDSDGHNGTVHGVMAAASGQPREMLNKPW